MGRASVRSVERLARDVAGNYGLSQAAALEVSGISTMNGHTDEKSDAVSVENFKEMLAFATAQRLARLTFWAVNRDRPCHPALERSGIEQTPLEFTALLAGYH